MEKMFRKRTKMFYILPFSRITITLTTYLQDSHTQKGHESSPWGQRKTAVLVFPVAKTPGPKLLISNVQRTSVSPLQPQRAITLPAVCTVLTPVSSLGPACRRSSTSFKLEIN